MHFHFEVDCLSLIFQPAKQKITFIFLCNAVKFCMYNHVEMIVVLYLNFFCIKNILPKSVYVCAIEIFQ